MRDIVIPTRTGLLIAAPAQLVDNDRLTDAWEHAKDRVSARPDMGWIRSNYVDLSPDDDLRPNENGHIFRLTDIEQRYEMVRDTPLNWLHHEQFIVGHQVDVELVYHDARLTAADPDLPPGAHLETIAAFYRGIYPHHWEKAKVAHDAGMLHASMEARPTTITCMNDGCCGKEFPFTTTYAPEYCAGLRQQKRKFIAHQPLFLGSAVVVPPYRPGWRGASSIEVATYIEQNLEQAEELFNQIAAVHLGELSDEQCEAILASLLETAGAGDGNGGRSRISMHQSGSGSEDFIFNLPADIKLPTLAEVRALVENKRDILREAEANLQGVIVTAVPPPEIAEQLAALGDEPVDQIHITLAFLGDSQGLDELHGLDGPVTAERLDAMVAVFATSEQPITARISGLGRFDLDHGNEVTYASVDAPGLNELRARLVDYLRAGGVNVDHNHGFSPHITLQYHRAGEGPTEMPDGLEWQIDSLDLWWGSDMHSAHHMGGIEMFDDAVAAIAIDAVRSVTETEGEKWDAFLEFVNAASVTTLQAVLDADACVRGFHHNEVYDRLIDRKFSTEERRALAEKGQAMPDGSFPTPTKADWMNARAAIGRAAEGDRAKVIAYLKRRAKALGIPDDEIPDTW